MKSKPDGNKLSKAVYENTVVLLAYYNVMANGPLWDAMLDDANQSGDWKIKIRALDLQQRHINIEALLFKIEAIHNDIHLLDRFPFRWFIRAKSIRWKNHGYTAANRSFRLLLLLRKVNPRPAYDQKITQLKKIIDQNI